MCQILQPLLILDALAYFEQSITDSLFTPVFLILPLNLQKEI